MIWRELILVRNGQVAEVQHIHFVVLDFQSLKHLVIKNGKKITYIITFETLRFFIKSSNFIKTQSKILFKEFKERLRKTTGKSLEDVVEKKEVSKYLRVISEYRQKIRQMKHRIKEEEGIE